MFDNHVGGRTFKEVRGRLRSHFLTRSKKVHPINWQGMDISKDPSAATHELMNVSFTVPLFGIEDLDHWAKDTQANLPWADNHFEERVCGVPINPGMEWANWPWGDNAKKFLDPYGKFNHNYMERYWPKWAGVTRHATGIPEEYRTQSDVVGPLRGIRNDYGDMDDLVRSLARDPETRQAWYPIFFPEDVGEVVGGRKPCSLGYQFMVREKALHIYYPLRSCDFFRHYNDDIYLTVRLGLWILARLRTLNPYFEDVKLGSFSMHCTSLHVFANDLIQMHQGKSHVGA